MKIIECPRDAMQGISEFIPTEVKAEYINTLLKVGFDTIDFGSFVSPKAIPQMRDTAAVLSNLDLRDTTSRLLAIVANVRGAQDAARFAEILYLGFPLSISETFQQRNTNKSINQALEQLEEIQDICIQNNKVLVTYISMGFGNPYGDPYDKEVVLEFVSKLKEMDIKIISLADTIGSSQPETIKFLFSNLTHAYPDVEFGAHLHSTPETAMDKLSAAYESGCRRFDGAIRGYGGCPMAKDDLTGNMATEKIIRFLESQKALPASIDTELMNKAIQASGKVFQ
ncbi:hydroxymethylglutaryl-CoA lyase [Roseivirga sp. BDSF3-8]|uniref:hydroxymethylglutaryl-CoA lyase n=1 Tax=Roseivirga sp. BDSF3-8 TaxID=3241598 RepID=UPI0035326194